MENPIWAAARVAAGTSTSAHTTAMATQSAALAAYAFPPNAAAADPLKVAVTEMSYKLTCPGCDRYLSSIFRAYADGRPCPHCGSSLRATSAQYYRQLPDDHQGV